MKLNDESDADYMVRVLREHHRALAQEAALADVKAKAAFDALMLAEKTKHYLEKQAETKAEQ